MTFAGVFKLCIWLLMIPVLVGSIFTDVDRQAAKLPFRWISGQLCLWAGFQIICVPLVLAQKDYVNVVRLFSLYAGALAIIGTVFCLKNKKRTGFWAAGSEKVSRTGEEYIAWGIFFVLLLFQLVQAVRLTYADGDDAFYVAVSTITENANTMYRKLPYTGGTTQLDARHGIAPFPVWISFLASVSGVRAVSVAHIAVPLAMITATYGIFYLLGDRLFSGKRERLPVFLVFAQLLVLFGDYSFYTAENFMLARSRQGKAALGNVVIPALFLLLLLLLERIKEGGKPSPGYWILLTAVMTSGCLCSTLGAMLTCMLTGIVGLCTAFCYRRFRLLVPLGLCCLPCVFFAALYLFL